MHYCLQISEGNERYVLNINTLGFFNREKYNKKTPC